MLDGVAPFLRGVRALFAFRDHQARPRVAAPAAPAAAVASWRARLADERSLDEHEALRLLTDFGYPANRPRMSNRSAALCRRKRMDSASAQTAVRGIDHKSDRDGVRLRLREKRPAGPGAMLSLIGPRALLAPMVEANGVELLLGMSKTQFGRWSSSRGRRASRGAPRMPCMRCRFGTDAARRCSAGAHRETPVEPAVGGRCGGSLCEADARFSALSPPWETASGNDINR